MNPGTTLVLIDLNADLDVLRAVECSRQSASLPRTIAYVSHVQADLIDAARRAGAHEVMARSAFVAKLPALLEAVRTQEAQAGNLERGER